MLSVSSQICAPKKVIQTSDGLERIVPYFCISQWTDLREEKLFVDFSVDYCLMYITFAVEVNRRYISVQSIFLTYLSFLSQRISLKM